MTEFVSRSRSSRIMSMGVITHQFRVSEEDGNMEIIFGDSRQFERK